LNLVLKFGSLKIKKEIDFFNKIEVKLWNLTRLKEMKKKSDGTCDY